MTIKAHSQTKRAIAASSLLAVTGAITLAAYTDHAEMETEFTTGTFGIAIDDDPGSPTPYEVQFDTQDLIPGETAETTVDLQNTGTIAADVDLVSTTGTAEEDDQAFLDALTGSYSMDGGASWSPEVPLTDLTTDAPVSLAGGESAPISIQVTFQEGAGNEAQDSAAAVNFRFEAVQAGSDDGGIDFDDAAWDEVAIYEDPSSEDELFQSEAEWIFAPLYWATGGGVPHGAPFRVVLDGSEQDLPGFDDENVGTELEPRFNYHVTEDDIGDVTTVTYVVERFDEAGEVVDSWDITLTLSIVAPGDVEA